MTNLTCTQIINDISFQRDLNWHLSNIIQMYWFIDTIVTTTFCHEFVRNISAKIIHHWLQSLLLLSNGPELALHRHDGEFKKNLHKFHTLQCKNNKLFCRTIIFFGTISIHCGGHHPVSVMVNTLFLKYTSCFCSTLSLRTSCSHPLEKYS